MVMEGEGMTLPLMEEVVGGFLASPPSVSAPPLPDPELHVLAVDDSFVDRKIIERLLRMSSCKVTTVDSGTRALEFLGLDGENNSAGFNDIKVNLIITDYSMPGMTGYELLKRIKESETFRDVPVVLLSSENIETRVASCLKEGAKDFLLKPLKLADVRKLKQRFSSCVQEKKGNRVLKRKRQDEKLCSSPHCLDITEMSIECLSKRHKLQVGE